MIVPQPVAAVRLNELLATDLQGRLKMSFARRVIYHDAKTVAKLMTI